MVTSDANAYLYSFDKGQSPGGCTACSGPGQALRDFSDGRSGSGRRRLRRIGGPSCGGGGIGCGGGNIAVIRIPDLGLVTRSRGCPAALFLDERLQAVGEIIGELYDSTC